MTSEYSTERKFVHIPDSNRGSEIWTRTLVSLLGLTVMIALLMALIRGVPEKTAFADVQAQVNRVKTVQFTNFSTRPNDPSEPRKLRVKILGRHLQITEVVGKPGRYDLIDSKAGRFITIDNNNKIFRELKTKIVINERTGERTEADLEIPTHVDFYENITSFPEAAFQHTGSGSVGDKQAERFERVYVNGLTTRTVSIWVDCDSRLPLHIEISLRSKDPTFHEVDFTYTDFIYDEPLDPALFNTHVREGFTVEDGQLIEYR